VRANDLTLSENSESNHQNKFQNTILKKKKKKKKKTFEGHQHSLTILVGTESDAEHNHTRAILSDPQVLQKIDALKSRKKKREGNMEKHESVCERSKVTCASISWMLDKRACCM
jgi:predicted RND superfamily exporter protein